MNINGVMLQGFHWFLKRTEFPNSGGRKLYNFLKDEAANLRAIGIDSIWIPPVTKAAFNRSNSVGYDVYDPFDLGQFSAPGTSETETKYGSRTELLEAIEALHGNGSQRRISVYADVILNHKVGGDVDEFWEAVRVDKENRNQERWASDFESGLIEVKAFTKFDYPDRADEYSSFKWSAKHFDSVDAAKQIRQGGREFSDPQDKYIYRFLFNEQDYKPNVKKFSDWVSLEKGNYDYLTGCDIDYARFDVREEMKFWGQWLCETLKLDGVRLDAVKHFSADFTREWVGHVRSKVGKNLFAVCEYIAGDTKPLHSYIDRVTNQGAYPQTVSLFDFPLRFRFGDVSRQGDAFDLRNLSSGTLMDEQPALAVTFVENHDYEYGRGFESHVEEWFKPLAYAYILLREGGYPCLFFPDYYGSVDWYEKDDKGINRLWHKAQHPGRGYLDLLLQVRKQFALGEERYYAESQVVGWVRLGFVPGAKGAMATVINTTFNAVRSITMNTGRFNKRFYHLATIKWTEGGFLVIKSAYEKYGNQAAALWTDSNGWGTFPADGGSVSLWIEDGVGLK